MVWFGWFGSVRFSKLVWPSLACVGMLDLVSLVWSVWFGRLGLVVLVWYAWFGRLGLVGLVWFGLVGLVW